MTFIPPAGVGAGTKPHHIETLKTIALLGGAREFVSISGKELGGALGVSQQSASQRILELLEEGLIQRDLEARRQRVRLTARGLDALRKEFADYQRIFEARKRLAFSGIVASGLGEGAFYMKQEGYRSQFRRKLGYEPYEGTLNLRVQGADLSRLEVLRQEEGIPIDGFSDEGRTFGGAKCFPAEVRGVECVVILPLRTHHDDNLELISRIHLRSKLDLADGDVVEVEVSL